MNSNSVREQRRAARGGGGNGNSSLPSSTPADNNNNNNQENRNQNDNSNNKGYGNSSVNNASASSSALTTASNITNTTTSSSSNPSSSSSTVMTVNNPNTPTLTNPNNSSTFTTTTNNTGLVIPNPTVTSTSLTIQKPFSYYTDQLKAGMAITMETIKTLFYIGSGGLRPLPSSFTLDPRLMQNILQQARSRKSDSTGAVVSLTPPLLALYLHSIDGNVAIDPNIVHPIIRIHMVDQTTGRYLRLLNPVRSVTKRRTTINGVTKEMIVTGNTPSSSSSSTDTAADLNSSAVPSTVSMLLGKDTNLPNCLSSSTACLSMNMCNNTNEDELFAAQAAVLAKHAGFVTSVPALNRTIAHDAALLQTAGVTKTVQLSGQNDTVGSHDSSLLYSDIVVFPVTLEEALSPNVLLLFEVLEHGGHLPKFLSRNHDNYHTVSWGYLKPLRFDGTSTIEVNSRITVGIPTDMGTLHAAHPSGTITSVTHLPLFNIQLYNYNDPTWEDRSIHQGSLLLKQTVPTYITVASNNTASMTNNILDVSDIPSPDIMLQYRMNNRSSSRLSLRLSAFGALIPSVRYIKDHELGITHTYIGNNNKPLQIQIPRISIADHPMLGRSRQLTPLPTDILQDLHDNLDLGNDIDNNAAVEAAAAQAALLAQNNQTNEELLEDTDPVTGKPLPPPYRIRSRSPDENCLVPGSIIGTLPTARQGATSVSVSPDGMLVAVACIGDQSFPIRIFEVARGRELAHLEGHGNIIYQVTWSADGTYLLSSSGDGTAMVWLLVRVRPGSIRFRTPPRAYCRLSHSPPAYVYTARFHGNDPGIIVTGSYDHGLRLWGSRIGEYNTTTSTTNHTSGNLISNSNRNTNLILEGSFLGYIGGINNGNTNELSTSLRIQHLHQGHVNCIEFDNVADSSNIARRMLTADSVGTILVWDIAKGKPDTPSSYVLIRKLAPSAFHGVPIVSLKVRPYHNQFMVLGQANLLRLFDLNTFAALRAYPNAKCTTSRLDAVFSPDGRYIATGNEEGTLLLWESDSGNQLNIRATTESKQKIVIGYPSLLLSVSWSPVSHMIALGAFGLEYPVMICT